LPSQTGASALAIWVRTRQSAEPFSLAMAHNVPSLCRSASWSVETPSRPSRPSTRQINCPVWPSIARKVPSCVTTISVPSGQTAVSVTVAALDSPKGTAQAALRGKCAGGAGTWRGPQAVVSQMAVIRRRVVLRFISATTIYHRRRMARRGAARHGRRAIITTSMERETILILDFGSQYTQLIARRLRELGVYSEIWPPDAKLAAIEQKRPRGIILSGGPDSVYGKGAPRCDKRIFALGVPVLGICYGMQLMGHLLGGKVQRANRREYGHAQLAVAASSPLFKGLDAQISVWMSHGDSIEVAPQGFRTIGETGDTKFAAMEQGARHLFGIQFHPEVKHTAQGMQVLGNFLDICGCQRDWNAASFVQASVERIRQAVGDQRVLCALSGGVDSAVTAMLIQRAIGERLTCVFVDNGLLRKNEAEQVRKRFAEKLGLKIVFVDAARRFLAKLKGVTDPERKRKIIGREFIEVFLQAARKLGRQDFLAQGTLYPDVIESTSVRGPSAVIKSHHNVGGLPKKMKFKLIEPLRELFKDEVRQAGLQLGLDEEFIYRQPFPGPGLAVRCLGSLTPPRLELLREADAIVVEEIKAAGLYRSIWQSFAVLLPVRSVGVMGDDRTYQYTAVLRVVDSADGMTADWVRLPHDLIARIANRIVNEVRGINRVVYDVSSKPPATIEWE
jgi:GMP synthase (glutamine-hydrolysing)